MGMFGMPTDITGTIGEFRETLGEIRDLLSQLLELERKREQPVTTTYSTQFCPGDLTALAHAADQWNLGRNNGR